MTYHKNPEILLIEDNPDMAYGLKTNLEFDQYAVDIASDAQEATEKWRQSRPDLIILDLMLPGADGFSVLKEIRKEDFGTPVLILSARDEELDKVQGFRFGADDYVTKPFGTMELLARVEALLRRSGQTITGNNTYRFGNVEVVTDKREVYINGEQIPFTPLQFDLLVTLLRNEGSVLSRETLLRDVWGQSEELMTRTVDTHIAELRTKIEAKPSEPEYVLTVPKVGYRFRKPE